MIRLNTSNLIAKIQFLRKKKNFNPLLICWCKSLPCFQDGQVSILRKNSSKNMDIVYLRISRSSRISAAGILILYWSLLPLLPSCLSPTCYKYHMPSSLWTASITSDGYQLCLAMFHISWHHFLTTWPSRNVLSISSSQLLWQFEIREDMMWVGSTCLSFRLLDTRSCSVMPASVCSLETTFMTSSVLLCPIPYLSPAFSSNPLKICNPTLPHSWTMLVMDLSLSAWGR